MRRHLSAFLVACCAGMLLRPAGAVVTVTDDSGRAVSLPSPARRIVSLAPHATELLFAAGAGDRIVGVTEFSDYPPQARKLPSVGGAVSLDLERILHLQPDLVVGWTSGNPPAQLARIESMGVPVFRSEPRDFSDVAGTIDRLSVLAATESTGRPAALAFRQRWQALRARYAQRRPLTAFYQIWPSPLMTLNGSHLVSSALRLCGAINVFAGLPQTAPVVSVETVIQADPDVIISGSLDGETLSQWRSFRGMKAVARDNLLAMNGELLNRSGPRVLDGTQTLCEQLDKVRNKR